MKKLIKKILNISQKYLKTDTTYLAKGGFWLTAKQVVTSLGALGLTIIMANLFNKETFGNYKYILSIFGILTITSLGGMSTAITQSSARGYGKTVIPAAKTSIKYGIIGSLVSLGFFVYYYLSKNYILSTGLLITTFLIPFYNPSNLGDSILIGQKKFKLSAKYETITNFINIILTISSLYITKNIFIVLIVYLSSFILSHFIVLKIIYHQIKDTNIDNSSIAYGKHLTVMEALWTVTKYLDKILIFNYLGPAELAVYSFAITPPEYLSTFLSNAKSLILPKFSAGDEIKIKKGLFRKMILFGIFILIAIIIYILICPFFYKILFPQYTESIFYSQIYALSLLAIVNIIPLSFIQSKKRIKELYNYNITIPILSIIILFLSVQFGIIGIVLGRIISRLINLFYISYLAKKF